MSDSEFELMCLGTHTQEPCLPGLEAPAWDDHSIGKEGESLGPENPEAGWTCFQLLMQNCCCHLRPAVQVTSCRNKVGLTLTLLNS